MIWLRSLNEVSSVYIQYEKQNTCELQDIL